MRTIIQPRTVSATAHRIAQRLQWLEGDMKTDRLPVGHVPSSENPPPERNAPATSSASVTTERIQQIAARAERATPTTEHIKRVRYVHGGGRMFRDDEDRKLIIDTYGADDREFYFHALDDVAFLLQALAVARSGDVAPSDQPANPNVLTSLRALVALYDGMDEKQFWSSEVKAKVLQARAVLVKVDGHE